MFNRLQTLVNSYDFISLYDNTVHLHDFIGFDDDWNEISNPNYDHKVAAEAIQIANELGFEIEFSSEDI